ncbi:hypothetical protein JCM16303_005312 [Sporobolomyces ruberrimus]
MSNDFDPIWTSLLEWLSTFNGSVDVEKNVELVHNSAGRGLVARSDLPPSSLLISIPNQALINLSTLSPLYPSPFTQGRLNATQLLSLHLAIQFRKHLFSPESPPFPSSPSSKNKIDKGKGKEKINSATSRDKFWPFLATLPRSFPSHPLTWSILSQSHSQLSSIYSLDNPSEDDISTKGRKELSTKDRNRYKKLLDCLGREVRTRVEQVESRFKKDWSAVQSLWNETQLEEGEEFGFFDFLLGWLNVNTRCIYYDLPTTPSSPAHWSKKENSLTLAPVIDMINHFPSLSTKPHPTPTALTFSSPSRSSRDKKVMKGDELAFSYGGHDDSFLLSEYGFIIGSGSGQGDGARGNEYNSLNVDRYVEGLFENQGEEGKFKIGILKEVDYWGDMTFQSHPASPSWRVLIALRLFHLRLPSHLPNTSSSDSLAPFYDLLSGTIDQISHLNEKKVQLSLRAIAQNLVVECQEGIERCQSLEREWKKEVTGGEKGLEEYLAWLKMVEEIWKGEERIARSIADDTEAK